MAKSKPVNKNTVKHVVVKEKQGEHIVRPKMGEVPDKLTEQDVLRIIGDISSKVDASLLPVDSKNALNVLNALLRQFKLDLEVLPGSGVDCLRNALVILVEEYNNGVHG